MSINDPNEATTIGLYFIYTELTKTNQKDKSEGWHPYNTNGQKLLRVPKTERNPPQIHTNGEEN